MSEQSPDKKNNISTDWLLRGVLTKLGDSFDRLTGRRWAPSSSLAASELIERIKKLLDEEAKEVPGKGTVVPHNIKLKMQWDKFAEGDSLESLRTELLTAAVDHINDHLYYTYAPVTFEIKTDYFTEGVKLFVSFDKFSDDTGDVEQNVTIQSIDVSDEPVGTTHDGTADDDHNYIAKYTINGNAKETKLHFGGDGRCSVGRTSANDLTLDDVSVSKIHASLSVGDEGVLSVADTGSTNGTFINDHRIAYGKAVRLHEGDRVKFGTIEVRFERTSTDAGSAPDDKP